MCWHFKGRSWGLAVTDSSSSSPVHLLAQLWTEATQYKALVTGRQAELRKKPCSLDSLMMKPPRDESQLRDIKKMTGSSHSFSEMHLKRNTLCLCRSQGSQGYLSPQAFCGHQCYFTQATVAKISRESQHVSSVRQSWKPSEGPHGLLTPRTNWLERKASS